MIPIATSLEEAFAAGAEARRHGLKPADNPYAMDDRQHGEWAAGWVATFDLDEEDDPQSNRLHKLDDVEPNA